jgi:hypothetical protein
MAFREVYNSAPLALDTSLDEFVEEVKAVWGQKDSVSPSGYSTCAFVRIESTTDINYFAHFIYRFDSITGEFVDRTNAFGAVYGIPVERISEHDGMLVYYRNLSVFTMEPEDFSIIDSDNTLWPPTGYWGGVDQTRSHFGWDRKGDRFFSNVNSGAASEIRTFVASTGQDTGVRTFVTGSVDPAGFQGAAVEMTRAPYAMAVSPGGHVTFFNFMTGQIQNVSRLATWDAAAGELENERVYGYDRYLHRILLLDHPAEVGSPPDFPGYIRGFNPAPQATRLQQPVAVLEPRVDKKVRIFTRAIGSAGEGIGGLRVTFSDQAVGDVAPVTVTTDKYGYAEALYDGLATGGAETITVTAETPADLFTPSPSQGSGGSISVWAPDVHLDFRDQVNLADVSALISQQVDWDKGTSAYGVDAYTTIKRTGRVSSARLRIQSGTAGTPTSGSNGSFGGDLAITDAVQLVGQGQELWAGVWVYFPTGFNFNTSSTGLILMRIGNDATANYVTIRMKHSAGTTHTGWALEWPDELVTDTRHDFTADSSVLVSADTWHFVQYYCQANTAGASVSQRLYIDSTLIWELVDDAARYRDTAGAGALTSFTANESIAMLDTVFAKLDELKIFNNWEGNAPSDQTCYVGNVVWSLDTDDLLPTDVDGYQYISPTAAEAL